MTARKGLILGALCVALACSVAQAASTVVYYDLSDVEHTPPPETVAATAVADGITALELSRGPGISAYSLTNGFSANEWPMESPSLQGAIDSGSYYQFGFVVEPGTKVSLETLDASFRRSSVNAPNSIEVHVSFDGFATPGIPVASLNYFGRTSGSAPAVDPLLNDPYYYTHSDLPGRPNSTTSIGDPMPTVDLTGIDELQNISGGTEVTFRLYAWGSPSTTPTNTFALGRMVGPRIGGEVTN